MHILMAIGQVLAGLHWQAALDLLLSTVIIYYLIMLIKGTRAVQLAWGLVVLFMVAKFAEWMDFRTISLMVGTLAAPGATVAIVILFYPELRHALEEVGRGRLWAMRGLKLQREDVSAVVDDLVATAEQLSRQRIGALMVLERDDGLDNFATTGTPIGASISPQLLVSIFYPGTPLHDGAAIIRGNEITVAACVLPLSDNSRISSSLHTRHRAALGLAERTDAAVLVVSEETGNISLAYDGRLLTALRPEVVRDKLLGLLQRDDMEDQPRDGGDGHARRHAKPPLDGEKAAPPAEPLRLAAARALRDLGQRAHRVVSLRGRAGGEAAD